MELILPVFAPLDLGTVLRSAVQTVEAHSNGLTQIHLAIPLNLPKIPGDVKSLERAFSAILDNACKFSPEGGKVLIEAQPLGSQVWVRVSDPGVGIPPEVLPHIFNRFFHTEEIDGRSYSGLGLGLSIAKKVIEQHKGQIKVESQVGRGTTVTMTLPVLQ